MNPHETGDGQKLLIYVTLAVFVVAFLCAASLCLCYFYLVQNCCMLEDSWQFLIMMGIFFISLLLMLSLWLRFMKEALYIIEKNNKVGKDGIQKDIASIKKRIKTLNKRFNPQNIRFAHTATTGTNRQSQAATLNNNG